MEWNCERGKKIVRFPLASPSAAMQADEDVRMKGVNTSFSSHDHWLCRLCSLPLSDNASKMQHMETRLIETLAYVWNIYIYQALTATTWETKEKSYE